MSKVCTICGKDKPLTEFMKNKNKPDGRGAWCRECKRERDRDHYANSEERRKKIRVNEEIRWRDPVKKERDRMLCNELSKRRHVDNYIPIPPSQRIWVRECIDTGVLFVAHSSSQIRCDGAQREHELVKARDGYHNIYKYKAREKWIGDNRIRTCNYCNKEYDFINEGSNKYCSDECRKKAYRLMRSNRNTHEKRAIMFNAECEHINRLKVFNRDKWRCQLCGIKVQKNDYLKDNAAELDHIIPLSRGGGHIYSNVQTLCRRCNTEKGNKLIGQLKIAI